MGSERLPSWAEKQKVLDVKNTSSRQIIAHKDKDKVKDKDKGINTPIPPKGDDSSFHTFWDAYPKKAAKPQAVKAFNKIKPDDLLIQKILSAIEKQKQSPEWTKDNGRFIPYPATWLNNCRWEDEDSFSEDTKRFEGVIT